MNRHGLRAEDFLDHLHQAATRILHYTERKSEADFLADRMVQDVVMRNIEILGEASKNLLEVMPDAQERFPDIPFRSIYAMRNQLAHGYFSASMVRVWEVVRADVPDLLNHVEDAITALRSTDSQ